MVRAWSGEFLANPPEHGQIARMIPRGRKFRARVTTSSYGPRQAAVVDHAGIAAARADIAAWPGYRPTPLVSLTGLTRRLGEGRVLHMARTSGSGSTASGRWRAAPTRRSACSRSTSPPVPSSMLTPPATPATAPCRSVPKVARYARGQSAIANQDAEFDVAVEGGIGEVRRGHEDRLAVRNHSLGVEHSRRAVEFERSRVVVDAGPRFAGPVGRPESIGEPAHELSRGGCVASFFAGCSVTGSPAARVSRQSGSPEWRMPLVRRSRRTCSPRSFVQPSPAALRTPAACPRACSPGTSGPDHTRSGVGARARACSTARNQAAAARPVTPVRSSAFRSASSSSAPSRSPRTECTVAGVEEVVTSPVSRAPSSLLRRCGGRLTKASVQAAPGRRRHRRARAPARQSRSR